jgi:lipopolysaccharide/colanic/teichoic acid biosynthesis glycosyltransferase
MGSLSRAFVPVGALALLFSEILLIAACFLVVTFLILGVDPSVFLVSDNGLLRIALAAASIVFGLYFEDLYVNIYVKSRVLLVQQLLLVMGIALVAQGVLGYVNGGLPLPLRLMVPACGVLVVALFAWRIAYSAFVLRVVGPQRILFVGMCPVLAEMAGYIGAHPELGLEVIGYVDDSEAAAAPECGKMRGPLGALPRIAAELTPDRLVVGFAEPRDQMPIADLLQLRYAGTAIDEASSAYEQLCGRVQLGELRPWDMLLSGAFRPRPQRLVYQSLAHGLLALILTILSAPLLLLAAVLLKLSSRGALLQRQECVGLGGRPFTLYSLGPAGAGQNRNRVQRFIRRWRFDRLPQLWNILRGEMCFVGPRAERSEFANILAERIPFYRQRHAVKPGLTGWAQINTPKDRPEDTLRRLEYDFYYLKYFSRGLDAYILVHSLREVLG